MKDHPVKRIYYAHSMLIYGTLKEKQELKILRKKFQNVLCPNQDIGDVQKGMSAYLKIVEWADLVVVSEYLGFIGKGVYSEIQHAQNNGIPVKCLRGSKLLEVKDTSIYNASDYRIRYGKLIV
jgi:hypothetical protein